jgi:hypothetical protein
MDYNNLLNGLYLNLSFFSQFIDLRREKASSQYFINVELATQT